MRSVYANLKTHVFSTETLRKIYFKTFPQSDQFGEFELSDEILYKNLSIYDFFADLNRAVQNLNFMKDLLIFPKQEQKQVVRSKHQSQLEDLTYNFD